MSIMHLGGRKYLIDSFHFGKQRKCSDCMGTLSQISQVHNQTVAFAYNDEDGQKFNGMIFCVKCFVTNGNHRKNIDVESALTEFVGGITA